MAPALVEKVGIERHVGTEDQVYDEQAHLHWALPHEEGAQRFGGWEEGLLDGFHLELDRCHKSPQGFWHQHPWDARGVGPHGHILRMGLLHTHVSGVGFRRLVVVHVYLVVMMDFGHCSTPSIIHANQGTNFNRISCWEIQEPQVFQRLQKVIIRDVDISVSLYDGSGKVNQFLPAGFGDGAAIGLDHTDQVDVHLVRGVELRDLNQPLLIQGSVHAICGHGISPRGEL
mmetsp:Transcript_17448/g.41415  ORF Transcript_17448/g.41415 Transcript_17448/m.41415 type:complete len:229 (+) Transcript_17448:337-1023(+)